MVQVSVTVKDIVTIHTDRERRLDQPMIEVTLGVGLAGKEERYEVRFSETLSNLADMTPADLGQFLEQLVKSYVETAYKGQRALDPKTREWAKKDLFLGKEFTVEI